MSGDFDHLKGCFLSRGIEEKYLDCWFSNYEISIDKQKIAFEDIKKAYTERRPMLLCGNFGGGKTHLATAMVKSHLWYGMSAWYYKLTSLFREYRTSLKSDELNESSFFDRLSTSKLLVIDEFNIRSDSEAENRFVQEVIDIRYANNRQTIFITNTSPGKFKELITERLVDRLREQKIQTVIFDWESHRANH